MQDFSEDPKGNPDSPGAYHFMPYCNAAERAPQRAETSRHRNVIKKDRLLHVFFFVAVLWPRGFRR